jgi:hypothetical protein
MSWLQKVVILILKKGAIVAPLFDLGFDFGVFD